MTKGITTLILVSFLSLCTCKNDNYTLLTKNYFNTYETKSFEELIPSFLSDTTLNNYYQFIDYPGIEQLIFR